MRLPGERPTQTDFMNAAHLYLQGLTLRDIAAELDVTPRTVARWLNNVAWLAPLRVGPGGRQRRPITHGTMTGYDRGCREPCCREVWNAWHRSYNKRRRAQGAQPNKANL